MGLQVEEGGDVFSFIQTPYTRDPNYVEVVYTNQPYRKVNLINIFPWFVKVFLKMSNKIFIKRNSNILTFFVPYSFRFFLEDKV